MKKILLITILSFIIFPFIVNGTDTDQSKYQNYGKYEKFDNMNYYKKYEKNDSFEANWGKKKKYFRLPANKMYDDKNAYYEWDLGMGM